MSFFHLWALTIDGTANFVPPGNFDGYTLLNTVIVSGPSYSYNVNVAGYGVSSGPWEVMAMLYRPFALYHGSNMVDPVVAFTDENGNVLRVMRLKLHPGLGVALVPGSVTGLAASLQQSVGADRQVSNFLYVSVVRGDGQSYLYRFAIGGLANDLTNRRLHGEWSGEWG